MGSVGSCTEVSNGACGAGGCPAWAKCLDCPEAGLFDDPLQGTHCHYDTRLAWLELGLPFLLVTMGAAAFLLYRWWPIPRINWCARFSLALACIVAVQLIIIVPNLNGSFAQAIYGIILAIPVLIALIVALCAQCCAPNCCTS